MSRSFNGTTDFVVFGAGAATFGQGPITIAALIKPTSAIGTRQVIGAATAGNVETYGILMDVNHYYCTNLFNSTTDGITNDWQWIVMTKASGSTIPRFHLKDVTTAGAWSHLNAGGNADNGTTPAASIGVGALPNGNRKYQGLVAAMAVWDVQFTDLQVESSCTLAASNLSAVSPPDWGTLWNQGSIATPVPDFSGGGGNQSAITGTTVSADDPPGFNYALTNIVSGVAVADLGALSATASGGVTHPGVGVADLGALSAAASGGVTVTGAALSDLGRLAASADVVPPDPDMFVSVLMNELLACLCENAAAQPNPPGICCFRVGTEIAHDAGILEDQCCEGIGYVALGDSFFSSESFPEADIVRQADSACAPTTYAQEFQVGLIRCAPVGNEFRGPNCTEWNAASRQNVVDAQTLRRVACCIRNFIIQNNDLFLGMSIVVDRQIQGNPQGGCVERSMKITIQFPNCEC